MIHRVLSRSFALLTCATALIASATAQENPAPSVSLANAYQTVTAAVPGSVVKFEVEVVRGRSDWEFFVSVPNQRNGRAAPLFRRVQVNGDTGVIVRNRLIRLGRKAPTTSTVNALAATQTAITAALNGAAGWSDEGKLRLRKGMLVWEVDVYPTPNPNGVSYEVTVNATSGSVLKVERCDDDGDDSP